MQAVLEKTGIKNAIDVVGGANKYQFRISAIVAVQYLFRSFFLIYYAYITQPPILLCKDSEGNFYNCSEFEGGCKQEKIMISPDSPTSLVIDLGFYCTNSYIRTVGGILFFVGGNIGVAYSSYLSDKVGRKTALYSSYLVGSIALLALGTIASGPFLYCLCLMLVWGGFSNFTVLSLTYVAEFSNEKFARNATAILLVSITVGELIAIALAYFITSWRVLFITCIALPALLTNFTFLFMKETPVFLASKKQYKEAGQILDEMASENQRSLEVNTEVSKLSTVKTSVNNQKSHQPTRSWNYIQILRHPKLTVRVLAFSFIKLYLCLAFFGCIFALSSLGGNMYVNSVIAAFAEGLGYTLSLYAYLFPVRKLLNYSLSIVVFTGIGFLFTDALSCNDMFICNRLFLEGVLSLVMRTAICFIYGFIYALGNELFPTEVRSQSNGISGIFSDMGGILAPIVLMFANQNQLNPLFLFGTMGFSALIAAKYLPAEPLTTLDDDIEMKYIKMIDNN